MTRRAVTTKEIRSYYSSTLADYKTFWMNSENLSMHFGHGKAPGTSHPVSLVKANEVLADLAQVSEGDRILDAGCGLGGSSMWLAKERRAYVTGVALGHDQIMMATREAGRRSLAARTQFLVADFLTMPFANDSFDVVWAHESICHAQERSAFFREAARVLVSNGRLIIADFLLRRVPRARYDKFLLEQWFDGWKLAGLWTAAQHADAAKAAGFDDVCIRDFTPHTIASHRRLYQIARRAFPVEMLLRIAGLRDPMRHRNFVAALRQYQTLRRACWFYGVISARKK